MKDKTKAILSGRDPEAHQGAVNTPVYHASTILYPSLDAIRGRAPMEYTYGRASARRQAGPWKRQSPKLKAVRSVC